MEASISHGDKGNAIGAQSELPFVYINLEFHISQAVMFHGFPQVQVQLSAADVPVDLRFHRDDEAGCVKTIKLQPVQRVRISFAALTHLGSLAQNATCHHAVFGELCGVQLNDTIEVTNIIPAVSAERTNEDEREDQREKRMAAQQQEEKQMRGKLEKMLRNEVLDSYNVGHFTVCSACANAPYSTRTAHQLAKLALDGHPSVLIVYDPFRTDLMGKLHLRAFVPTAEYIDFYGKFTSKRNALRENRLVRDCRVTKHGVLREVRVEVDVDEYQLFCLDGISVAPLPSSCTALQSETMTDYTTALLESVQRNADELSRMLGSENNYSQKEDNYGPLAQRIDTLLKLMQLKEQSQHLESLCDGVLLNSSLLRDL